MQDDLHGPLPSDLARQDHDDPRPPLTERRWWPWALGAIATVIVLGFALPLLLPLFSGGPAAEPTPTPVAGTAPGFVLPAAAGGQVRLSETLAANEAVVVLFYRGFF
jgi:hypothetical protein